MWDEQIFFLIFKGGLVCTLIMGFVWINASRYRPRRQKHRLLIDVHISFTIMQLFRSTSNKVSGAFWQVKYTITRLNSALKVSKITRAAGHSHVPSHPPVSEFFFFKKRPVQGKIQAGRCDKRGREASLLLLLMVAVAPCQRWDQTQKSESPRYIRLTFTDQQLIKEHRAHEQMKENCERQRERAGALASRKAFQQPMQGAEDSM